jgi:hypothetical protein
LTRGRLRCPIVEDVETGHPAQAAERPTRRPGPRSALVTRPEHVAMLEMLVLVFLVVCGLTVLDAVAARVGVESRPPEHVDWTSPEPILWV